MARRQSIMIAAAPLQASCARLHACRSYAAHEVVELPAGAAAAGMWPAPAAAAAAGLAAGPEEHRIDGFQLRNEAAFINDFRDDVSQPDAASLARRRRNLAGIG